MMVDATQPAAAAAADTEMAEVETQAVDPAGALALTPVGTEPVHPFGAATGATQPTPVLDTQTDAGAMIAGAWLEPCLP
jgi:hypothetical protein